jgi:hypothetical protein
MDERYDSPELRDQDQPELNSFERYIPENSSIKIEELVGLIVSEKNVRFEDTVKGLYKAIKEGKVRFVDPNPPKGLFEFATSIYNVWFWVLVGFIVLVVISIYGIPQTYPFSVYRYVVGAVFVLYLPGYSIIEAFYPKRDSLRRLERFVLSVGLSLAVVPLVGLALNYTPWGIRFLPSLIALSLLTITLGILGVYRKYSYWRLN